MILGILSDTHEDEAGALPHIIEEFRKRKVEKIIHCGDIEEKHLDPKLFGNLPVICALVDDQVTKERFQVPPEGWDFTKPEDRVRDLTPHERIYVGHKKSFDLLRGSEAELAHGLQKVRMQYDRIRIITGGHTHHAIYQQGRLISFVNPGAVTDSFDGHEFAVFDTKTREIVFCRIPRTSPIKDNFSVGVISDSLNISEMDPGFWKKLAAEFEKRGVREIIHCGNICVNDVGNEALAKFQVHYNLRSDQKVEKNPDNWHPVVDKSVVEINGCRFYIQLDLGAELLEKSEYEMSKLCLSLRRNHPEIRFVLCGFTSNALYEEGSEMRIVNPGDIITDRNFAVICLPRTEITFGHVPVDPLPPLPKVA
ncbi:MAG: metallophosphoesterase family protein [Candidatus Staskawiczbacteria bacterium]|nr:metallophosphoesterase family protein [Candidatus Staskawiczbacteria bacterium]